MLFLELDEASRAHLARAVDDHRRWCRVNGFDVPAPLHQLSVTLAARDGQARPQVAEPLPLAESGPVALTYAAAAALLSVSPRTIRRIVGAGQLPTIDIAGCKRITRTAIEQYLHSKENGDGTSDAA